MKTYIEICELNYPLPDKSMEIREQEAEILCAAVYFPSLSLIVPLQNVKFIKTGKKASPKPPPVPTPRPAEEATRTEAKKSPAKKSAKPKSTVRTPKSVRSK